MLKWLAQHSPILMLVCCILGFSFPEASRMLLPILPYVLFFLMFFTLLGINQRQLLRLLISSKPWTFALLHTVFMCVVFTTLAVLLGIRGDLLLAIAALTATAPLFATGALVKSVGYDALQAMANTIAATLFMPLVLLIVLWVLVSGDSRIDFVLYFWRLLIYLVGPMFLAGMVRHFVNEHVLERVYPKVSQVLVILVFTFPLGLTADFRRVFDQSSQQGLILFALALVLGFGSFAIGYILYRKAGEQEAMPAAIASGGRNVVLTYTIAGAYLGGMYLPLVGAMQLPMYTQPLLVRAARRYALNRAKKRQLK